MNFQAGDLIITKHYLKNSKKYLATIIEVREADECGWNEPSIIYQYCYTGEKYRLSLTYLTRHFLDTTEPKSRWKHFPVKK